MKGASAVSTSSSAASLASLSTSSCGSSAISSPRVHANNTTAAAAAGRPQGNVKPTAATTGASISISNSSNNAVVAAARDSTLGPPQPSWVLDRSFFLNSEKMSLDAKKTSGGEQTISLGKLPVEIQEMALIDDLLSLMTGVGGKYIHFSIQVPEDIQMPIQTSILTDRTGDESLMDLVKRIVPSCTNYISISAYLEVYSRYQHGLVAQAFTSAIRELLKEYLVLVAQLETQFRRGELSLHKFWYYVQPTQTSLKRIASFCKSASSFGCTGGDLLTLLYDRSISHSGDENAKQLYSYLLERAAIPYFDMLKNWIFRGVIEDAYHEFLVTEHQEFRKENLKEDYNDAYWEERFTLNRVPSFLEPFAEKILTTGKYLNVIRECGLLIEFPYDESKLVFKVDDNSYWLLFDQCYQYASETLLTFLMKDQQLLSRLSSIQSYFFLRQGDFLIHFLDSSEQELRKTRKDISLIKLQSLLELSLRTSSASLDVHHDDIRCELQSSILYDQLDRIINVEPNTSNISFDQSQTSILTFSSEVKLKTPEMLTGFECFSLDYNVKWPLSLILSKKTIIKYQLIFRHLFHCKHVEKELCRTWLDHQSWKRNKDVYAPLAIASFSLHQRMLSFVQSLQYYMQFEVLEPNWQLMQSQLKTVRTVDEVLNHHTDFLDSCLKECMLTNRDLLITINKLLSRCFSFAKYSNTFSNQNMKTKAFFEATMQNVKKFEGSFHKHLKRLIELLNHYSAKVYEHHMANLIIQLDYNSFYSELLPVTSTMTPAPPPPSAANKTSYFQ